MNRFMNMQKGEFEQIHYFYDSETKMKAVVCLHDTTLGPAIGGIKLLPIKLETQATELAMRNAKLMTYKSSLSGVDLGGGSMVVLGHPDEVKTEAFLRTIGRKIQTLNGRIRLVGDANMSADDMGYVHLETDYADEVLKGSIQSLMTSTGVIKGLDACLLHKYGSRNLHGKHVLIQGIGRTGSVIAETLLKRGAKVSVADINDALVIEFAKKHDVNIVENKNVFIEKCDVMMPCAEEHFVTIDRLSENSHYNCDIIVGSANNQLEKNKCGRLLYERGIIYAPDYVINSGGLIAVYLKMMNKSKVSRETVIDQIEGRMLKIIDESNKIKIPTNAVADRMARERIEISKQIRSNYI